MKKYIIEKNIPIPDSEEIKHPFAEMEIGDSFFISLIDWVDLSMFNGGLQRLVDFYTSGKGFIYRPIYEPIQGFRVWRIK